MAKNVEPPSMPSTAQASARLCNFPHKTPPQLMQEHRDWLEANVKPICQNNPSAWIDVYGFASQLGSKSGDPDHNRKLSIERAELVKKHIRTFCPTANFPVPQQNEGFGSTLSPGGPRDDDGYWRAVEVHAYAVKPAVIGPSSAPVKRCGPKIDEQFAETLLKIERDFRSWTNSQQFIACQRLVFPLNKVSGKLEFDTNVFDMLPIFQGKSWWLRKPEVIGLGCGTPCLPLKPGDEIDDAEIMDFKHADPSTCSLTVQIGDKCWLSGNVNYGTFGFMVRLCHQRFNTALQLFKGPLLPGVGFYEAGLSGIYWYKTHNPYGKTTGVGPEIPIRWYKATFFGGHKGIPKGDSDRQDCTCGCSYDANNVNWDYAWEPNKPRLMATQPWKKATSP